MTTLPVSTAYRVFWAGKYLERAECVSRFLAEKVQFISSQNGNRDIIAEVLDEFLKAFDVVEKFNEKYKDVTEEDVLHYFILEPENTSSIFNSVSMARENIAGSMPDKIYDEINKLYIKLESDNVKQALKDDAHTFLVDTKQNCNDIAGMINAAWG